MLHEGVDGVAVVLPLGGSPGKAGLTPHPLRLAHLGRLRHLLVFGSAFQLGGCLLGGGLGCSGIGVGKTEEFFHFSQDFRLYFLNFGTLGFRLVGQVFPFHHLDFPGNLLNLGAVGLAP